MSCEQAQRPDLADVDFVTDSSWSCMQDHSAVPEKDEDWPALQEILAFRDRVRQRVLDLYDDLESGKRARTRRTDRILWMTYEHEAFHAEVSSAQSARHSG